MPSAVPLRCMLISIVLGMACELVSGRLQIWTYRNRATLVSNVILMFGVVQGLAIAGLVGGNWSLTDIAPLLFMLGGVVGLIYEGLNEFVVHNWSWSKTPLLGLTRSRDKAAVVGVAWGFAPVAVAVLARTPMLS